MESPEQRKARRAHAKEERKKLEETQLARQQEQQRAEMLERMKYRPGEVLMLVFRATRMGVQVDPRVVGGYDGFEFRVPEEFEPVFLPILCDDHELELVKDNLTEYEEAELEKKRQADLRVTAMQKMKATLTPDELAAMGFNK